MAILPFEASVRHAADSAIVDLRGEIDGFAEQTLNAAYAEAAADPPGSPSALRAEGPGAGQGAAGGRTVLLNFTGVNYINSTGIALIVGLLAQARKSGRRLLTYGLSDHYVEIFKITRLSDFMSIFADEAAALAAAGGGGAS